LRHDDVGQSVQSGAIFSSDSAVNIIVGNNYNVVDGDDSQSYIANLAGKVPIDFMFFHGLVFPPKHFSYLKVSKGKQEEAILIKSNTQTVTETIDKNDIFTPLFTWLAMTLVVLSIEEMISIFPVIKYDV
jgi:hypothetical protein